MKGFAVASLLLVAALVAALPVGAEPSQDEIAAEILERMNKIRGEGYRCVTPNIPKNKLHLVPLTAPAPAVTMDESLVAAARNTVNDMLEHPEAWTKQNTGHIGGDGSTPDERLRRAEQIHDEHYPVKRFDGYAEIVTNFGPATAEQAAEQAVNQWLASFHHCMTMMSDGRVKADVAGVAIAERPNARGTWVAVIWFGEFNDHIEYLMQHKGGQFAPKW